MPALLGYLVAIAILLGGGYAGLEWLGSPDSSVHQPRGKRPTSAGGIGQLKSSPVPEITMARSGDSSPGKNESALTTATPSTRSGSDDVPKTHAPAADETSNSHPDTVPAGGCMPIGLTAQGEMVFPLQCRELLERQRGPVASSLPNTMAPSPSKEPDVSKAYTAKPAESGSGEVSDSSKLELPAGSTGRADSAKNDEAKTEGIGPRGNRPADQGRPKLEAQGSHDDIQPSGTVKPSRSKSDGKPRKSDEKGDELARSKLLREQRLLPLERDRRMAVHAGDLWYNVLGFR